MKETLGEFTYVDGEVFVGSTKAGTMVFDPEQPAWVFTLAVDGAEPVSYDDDLEWALDELRDDLLSDEDWTFEHDGEEYEVEFDDLSGMVLRFTDSQNNFLGTLSAGTSEEQNKLIPLHVLDEAHRVLEQFPELRGRHDYPEMVKFLDKVGSGHDAPNLYSECFQAAFGTAWEQSGKQIYTFDFELAHALATQTDLAVAADTLKRLPFRCGYVQLPKTIRYNGWPADGFFAYLHDDELELLVCGANGRWFGRAPVKLTAKTFAESWAMTENLPATIH